MKGILVPSKPMNFNIPLLRPIRILLFPFSLVYALVVKVRNWCFDKKIFTSTSFNLPIICVGNLAVGGTGKSPMVELLIRMLKDRYAIAVLSRGYKRKTRGYALAGESTTALDIGDEPMQFHSKFPDVAVAVGEERIVAIPQLLHDRPGTRAIILDDAFQHRAVKAGLNVLLTDYSNLFTRDWWLPSGDLRDAPSSYRRADIIVVTKCPEAMDEDQRRAIEIEIDPKPHQQIFFSTISYGTPYHITRQTAGVVNEEVEVLLVTGIANPAPLKRWLNEHSRTYYELAYSDHHIFTIDDLQAMIRRFTGITAGKKLILTTEKDAVRLIKFKQELEDWPIYVLPISPGFLFGEEDRFANVITTFINEFK
ncbi:tetraacyldisaccharide 4'-kinase [Puia dinghuensis]|uniref:Tetraacyldisaccharide 4'-kinase n=1 Tax=Puia dinghuensis TaxID=1792502 RepID=A0A8J2XN68_9BACT|nr:tetraacyldisaccharide 4'-kinase [Puia dinghuensis]GGA82646.1 tetraacyldisaccharide 4'-kinase [Puia dinghuensis]